MIEETDIFDLTNDNTTNDKTPYKLMMNRFEVDYGRDWRKFLNSIEWDSEWLRHETEEERKIRLEEIEERKRQHEWETHPFRQWF